MFIDRVKIECRAGSGGNGAIAWRREKFIPKGGPSGGDGGRGGSVIFRADHNVYSLDWFTYKRILSAENGQAGSGGTKHGRNGEDLIIKIPCGTTLKDSKTGELLFDFIKDGDEFALCVGGKGGRGNHHFRSATNRAPNISTPGKEGGIRFVELELKLIADVGIIGLPNAGKSTLIKKLCAVKVKIGAYPFTTLTPNLGYMHFKEGAKLLLADIPGIIRGASQNKGLGIEFLRHIERTKALLYVIDSSMGIIDDFEILQSELTAYDPKLLERPFMIVLNKCDLEDSAEHIKAFKKKFAKFKKEIVVVSAEEGEGCDVLRKRLQEFATVPVVPQDPQDSHSILQDTQDEPQG